MLNALPLANHENACTSAANVLNEIAVVRFGNYCMTIWTHEDRKWTQKCDVTNSAKFSATDETRIEHIF